VPPPSTALPRPRVLVVDDDRRLLDAMTLLLAKAWNVVTRDDPRDALRDLGKGEAFAVLVTDLRMPGMDGLDLLRRARDASPDTISVLLTGQADLADCVRAVNECRIFRFLEKPCDPEEILRACDAALEQHRLVRAQRELLEETLRGAIQTLVDVLALAMPTAFGRAERLAEWVGELARAEGRDDAWAAEMGAMLSQLGCASLPAETLEKLNAGAKLDPREEAMVARMPQVVTRLLRPIPRLEPVLDVIRLHTRRYDGKDTDPGGRRRKDLPWGARALRIAVDYDALLAQGLRPDLALSTLRGREGSYDPDVLAAFAKLQGARNDHVVVRELALRLVRPEMTFVQDVRLPNGTTLVARGQMVTASLLERIRNLPPSLQEIQVRVMIAVRGLAETTPDVPTVGRPGAPMPGAPAPDADPVAIPAVRLPVGGDIAPDRLATAPNEVVAEPGEGHADTLPDPRRKPHSGAHAPPAATIPSPAADPRRLRLSQVDLAALRDDLDDLDPLV
jgi:response regulator RpfG family c-di-GMP phosphodiesterase